jgi:hypothetical protein
VQQLLITYHDVVSGGFSVIRNDGGQYRAHFGMELSNSPRACTTGYVSTAQTPSPSAVASVDTNSIRCAVVNGVDPNGQADGADESGSDIRGAQNIGRSGGQGASTPPGSLSGGPSAASQLQTLLGTLLQANSFSTTTTTLSQLPTSLLHTGG